MSGPLVSTATLWALILTTYGALAVLLTAAIVYDLVAARRERRRMRDVHSLADFEWRFPDEGDHR